MEVETEAKKKFNFCKRKSKFSLKHNKDKKDRAKELRSTTEGKEINRKSAKEGMAKLRSTTDGKESNQMTSKKGMSKLRSSGKEKEKNRKIAKEGMARLRSANGEKHHDTEDIEIRQCKICLEPPILPYTNPSPREKETFKRHQIVIDGNGQSWHQCTLCFSMSKVCTDNVGHQIMKHSVTDVPETKGYQCPDCLKLFRSRRNQRRHSSPCQTLSWKLVAEVSSPYRCDACWWLCSSEEEYEKHWLEYWHRAFKNSIPNNEN